MKKPVCVVIIWEERVISPWGIDPRGDTIEIFEVSVIISPSLKIPFLIWL